MLSGTTEIHKRLNFCLQCMCLWVIKSDHWGRGAANVGLLLWLTYLQQTKHLQASLWQQTIRLPPPSDCLRRQDRLLPIFFCLLPRQNTGARQMMDWADWHGWTTFLHRRAWWIRRISSPLYGNFYPCLCQSGLFPHNHSLINVMQAVMNWLSVK